MAQEKDLQEELATLKADVKKLSEDVGDLLGVLRELGVDKVNSARSSLDEELDRRRDELRTALNSARARGEKAADAVEGEIAQHPMSSVMAAFGMGFLIAKLLDVGRTH